MYYMETLRKATLNILWKPITIDKNLSGCFIFNQNEVIFYYFIPKKSLYIINIS